MLAVPELLLRSSTDWLDLNSTSTMRLHELLHKGGTSLCCVLVRIVDHTSWSVSTSRSQVIFRASDIPYLLCLNGAKPLELPCIAIIGYSSKVGSYVASYCSVALL